MTFFYDLNKKLDAIREKPEMKHGQLNERAMGKHTMADEGNAFSKAVVDAKKDGIQPGEKIRVGGKEMPLKEKMSPAKQKSFAALAPPKDKITFADKIAGAKQEVDEMLGDVAAEAMKKAISKMGGDSHQARTTMKHVDASNASPKVKSAIAKASKDIKPGVKGYGDRAAALRAAGVKGAPGEVQEAHDDDDDVYSYQDPAKKKTHKTASGGTVTQHGNVTRHQAAPGHYGGYDPESHPDKDDDKSSTPAGEKRGRGRPKGTGKSIGAKGPSGKSKLMKREGADDIEDQGEYDQEGDMALDDINTIESAANELQSIIDANENLPEWVQSKINKAMDYLDTARDYMAAQQDDEQMIDEKAVSKKQQKFMGMVHAAQKGEKPASKEVAKVAKTMKKGDAEDFASTKHKGLPEKKAKKKEVDETTVAGSVAVGGEAPKDPGAPKAKKSGGGMVFGKGVYEGAIAESFNKKLSTVLNEGMNINMTTDSEGHQSLTVTATDDDAAALADLLKMAGLGNDGSAETCSTCGESACGCEQMAEGELANSPEPEYSDSDTMLNTLSGGLNGRKSTGQTTIPVVSRDPRRGSLGPVAESNESRLWELYNRYETK